MKKCVLIEFLIVCFSNRKLFNGKPLAQFIDYILVDSEDFNNSQNTNITVCTKDDLQICRTVILCYLKSYLLKFEIVDLMYC